MVAIDQACRCPEFGRPCAASPGSAGPKSDRLELGVNIRELVLYVEVAT